MAKLRKMLGRADDPEIIALMRLMETQSSRTLACFAADYARENWLPVYEAHCPQDGRVREALDAAAAWARAAATAAGVMGTPTNALGMCFYGAAAVAYHTLGVCAPAGKYDEAAAREFVRIHEALSRTAVPDEAHPVKINWNC